MSRVWLMQLVARDGHGLPNAMTGARPVRAQEVANASGCILAAGVREHGARSPFRELRPETWNGNIMEHRSQMQWNTNHI